jgi:hypothetical protein
MSCWKTQRKKTLCRDGNQCQICGDFPGCPHTVLQVHHIVPRECGGTDDLKNLITLCDGCHANCHSHMGHWMNGVPKGSQKMQEIHQNFVEFVRMPLPRRYAFQQKMWSIWGVVDRKPPSVLISIIEDPN